MGYSKRCLLSLIYVIPLIWPQFALADAEKNLQIMLDAARKLEWGFYSAQNEAFLLVKNETIEAPVGVIFGYADNKAACEELAETLSKPLTVGTFHCQTINW
jgi:hypothetical protein